MFWSAVHWAHAVWQGSVTHMLSVYVVLGGLLWSGLTQSLHTYSITSLQNTYLAVALRLRLQASIYRFNLKTMFSLCLGYTHTDDHAYGTDLVIRPRCAVIFLPPLVFSPSKSLLFQSLSFSLHRPPNSPSFGVSFCTLLLGGR